MKILLISVKSSSPTGGIAVWTECFLSHCQTKGIHCHLVNTELVGKRVNTIKRNWWDELIRTIRIVRALRKEINTNTFDAVYMNTSCGTYGLFRDTLLAWLVSKKNIPLITHYHCEIPYWVKRKISIRCLKVLVCLSQKNLVLCENSKTFLKDNYQAASHKVPNFVDSSLIRRDAKPIRDTIKHIVFVGQVTETKGAVELYEVAQGLSDVRFTLIGSVGASMKKHTIPGNVHLTGSIPKDQVLTYLDDADLFLLPSHTEGCSLALMEAMARGLPAIATNTGANAELLANGCGLVVACHDVEAMIQAIHQATDPCARQEMARNALKRITENYTEENVEVLFEYIQHHK